MLKDIFGSLGFVIVGSDILFWAYFFIMDNTCIPFVLINDRKMIDANVLYSIIILVLEIVLSNNIQSFVV